MPQEVKVKNTEEERKETPFDEFVRPDGTERPKYSEDEKKYLAFLIQRLTSAKAQRDRSHDEFDGMDYLTYYETNQKAALSYIPPRNEPEETNIVTGTTREKKLAVMSNVLNLNLQQTIRSYDRDNLEEVELGQALTHSIDKSEELESWELNEMILAYDEITSQGNVFVEENWEVQTRWKKSKIMLDKITDATFEDFNPKKSLIKTFVGAKRRVVPGPFVYLGNIKLFDEQEQPYMFTKEIMTYEEAKSFYGHLPRWKNVPKQIDREQTEDVWGMDWTLTEDLPEGWVEVIKYQDRWYDDYQIQLNGVMQLPIGFPMPWKSGKYNIIKGNLEVISSQFAYCKGIPAKTKVDQAVLDEMYRLSILKTEKSFIPPMANYSANILSRNSFLPGKVLNDLEKGEVEVLGGDPRAYQLNSSEIEMIKMIKDFIDEKSVDKVTSGQAPSGNPTATEVERVAQQARIKLGLIIFGFMSFHQKLAYSRLDTLLEHWTKPMSSIFDKAKGELVPKYMKFSIDTDFSDAGAGSQVVEFTDRLATPNTIADIEEGISRDESGKVLGKKKQGRVKRLLQININVLNAVRYKFFAEVTPMERDSSLTAKVVFTQQLGQAMQLWPNDVNKTYAQSRWSAVNKIPQTKMFSPGSASQLPADLANAEEPTDDLAPEAPAEPSINQLEKA